MRYDCVQGYFSTVEGRGNVEKMAKNESEAQA